MPGLYDLLAQARFRVLVDEWFADDSSQILQPIHVGLGISITAWNRWLSSGGKVVPAAYVLLHPLAPTDLV